MSVGNGRATVGIQENSLRSRQIETHDMMMVYGGILILGKPLNPTIGLMSLYGNNGSLDHIRTYDGLVTFKSLLFGILSGLDNRLAFAKDRRIRNRLNACLGGGKRSIGVRRLNAVWYTYPNRRIKYLLFSPLGK